MIEAYRGEFGLKVMYHVPQVHTLCLERGRVVEIEHGEEALYPAAMGWSAVMRVPDAGRVGPPPDFGVEPTRFVPLPVETNGIECDVVICPRSRSYGANKNWPVWGDLERQLRLGGIETFAGGAPDSSSSVTGPRAWHYERFLDATLEAMHAAKLVIATDAGLAHLAILAGRPLMLVTYRGMVAPGPVVDSSGREVAEQYWQAGYPPQGGSCRFAEANHKGVPIVRVDGWSSSYTVACAARKFLEYMEY